MGLQEIKNKILEMKNILDKIAKGEKISEVKDKATEII